MNIPAINELLPNPAERILAGDLTPNLYRVHADINPDHLVVPLSEAFWRGFYIEGQVVKTKADFLRMAGAAMEFPSYYGHNWDAFEELITDLSWIEARGFVLIYDSVWPFARHDPAGWRQARTILAEAVTYWRATPTPLYVLLRNTRWYARDIEKL